jgi:hypothetical protein
VAEAAGKSLGAALTEVGADCQQLNGGVYLSGFTEKLLKEARA